MHCSGYKSIRGLSRLAEVSDCNVCGKRGVIFSVTSSLHFAALKYTSVLYVNVGRDSAVGIGTRYGLDGQGIESLWEARFSAPVQTGRGAHPASCTMGSGSFLGVKRPGRGVDHPPHLAPRLKKE
jgi:hypothetical protein